LGDKPAIVDFYASWCGPCKTIAPILEELAAEYGDQIYIYKVDTEEEQELAAAFGIRSIPTLLFIPMDGEPQMAQGAMPKASFKEAIEKVLLKK
jgi:thioredoxin